MTEVVSGELVTYTLTKREQSELRKQELRIEKALPGFLELADALQVIRDGRLYRAEFATFDDYVSARWDMSRQRVSQLTSAAETVRNLPPELSTRVTTERAARVIRQTDPKPAKLRKALDKVASEDGTEGSAAALERALTPPKVVTAVDSGSGDVFGVLIAIAPAVAEGIASRPRGEVDSIASAVRAIATALNARREADKPVKPVAKTPAVARRKTDGKRQFNPRPKAGK